MRFIAVIFFLLLVSYSAEAVELRYTKIPELDPEHVEKIWKITALYADLPAKTPLPPIEYLPFSRWDGIGVVFGEAKDGVVYLYGTAVNAGLYNLPALTYAVLAEEMFHYALSYKEIAEHRHHCIMIIPGFWSWPEERIFTSLLGDLEKLGIIDSVTNRWMKKRLESACTYDLNKMKPSPR